MNIPQPSINQLKLLTCLPIQTDRYINLPQLFSRSEHLIGYLESFIFTLYNYHTHTKLLELDPDDWMENVNATHFFPIDNERVLFTGSFAPEVPCAIFNLSSMSIEKRYSLYKASAPPSDTLTADIHEYFTRSNVQLSPNKQFISVFESDRLKIFETFTGQCIGNWVLQDLFAQTPPKQAKEIYVTTGASDYFWHSDHCLIFNTYTLQINSPFAFAFDPFAQEGFFFMVRNHVSEEGFISVMSSPFQREQALIYSLHPDLTESEMANRPSRWAVVSCIIAPQAEPKIEFFTDRILSGYDCFGSLEAYVFFNPDKVPYELEKSMSETEKMEVERRHRLQLRNRVTGEWLGSNEKFHRFITILDNETLMSYDKNKLDIWKIIWEQPTCQKSNP